MPELPVPTASQNTAPVAELMLRVCGTPHDGRLVRLRGAKCTIGSASQCSLRLQAAGVSPLHCLILRGPDQCIVRSWSGETRVNGKSVGEAVLAPGDRLTVGTVEFEVVDGAAKLPDPSPAVVPSAMIARSAKPAQRREPANDGANVAPFARGIAKSSGDAARSSARHGRTRARRLLARLRELHRESELNALQLHRLQEAQASARELLAQRDAERQRLNDEQLRAETLWEKQRRRLADEQRELERERRELDTHCLQLQRERDQSLADLARRADELNDRAAELDKLRRDLESQQRQRLVESESRSAELARHRDQLMHEREALAAEAEAERARIDADRQELEEQRRRLSADTLQLTERQAALERQRVSIEEQQEGIAKARRAFEEEKATLNTERAAWEHDRVVVERLRSEVDEERAAIEHEQASLHEERAAVESQQMLLQQELREFEAHKHSLTLERLDWQTETSRAEAELAGRREDLDRRAAALSKQQADQDSARRRIDDSQKSLTKRQETIEQAEADLLERKRQIHEERLAFESERQGLEQAQSLLASDRQLHASEQAALASEQAALASEQAALASERQAIEALRQQCRNNESEWSQRLTEQTRQLTEATERLNRATHELEQQQELLEAARRELDDERQSWDHERQRLQEGYEQQMATLREKLSSQEDVKERDSKAAEEHAAEYDHRWSELNQWAKDLEQLAEELRQQAEELADGRKRLEERLAENNLHGTHQPAIDGSSFAEASDQAEYTHFDSSQNAPDVELQASEDDQSVDTSLPHIALLAEVVEQLHPQTEAGDGRQEQSCYDVDSCQLNDAVQMPASQFEAENHLPLDAATEHADESIDDYMARLLKRVRGVGTAQSPVSEHALAAPSATTKTDTDRISRDSTPTGAQVPAVQEVPPKMTRRTAAPELSSDLKAMRELANMTARAAIDKHAYRNWGRAAFGKLAIALLAGGAGSGAVYFAPARDSMLMYAGLSCFVVALFWLLQAGILTKNVIQAARRHRRMPEEKKAPDIRAEIEAQPLQSDELPPAEIITVCETDDYDAGGSTEAIADGFGAESSDEYTNFDAEEPTAEEPCESLTDTSQEVVNNPVG